MKKHPRVHMTYCYSNKAISLLFLLFLGIVGVQIREMRVPSAVESGSQPHVILDCDYDLSESERSQVDVKWYFRDDPQPFFQVEGSNAVDSKVPGEVYLIGWGFP